MNRPDDDYDDEATQIRPAAGPPATGGSRRDGAVHGGRPRPGAPSGPPPPAESFRPAGPPPPADWFQPAARRGPGGNGAPGAPGYTSQPGTPAERYPTPRPGQLPPPAPPARPARTSPADRPDSAARRPADPAARRPAGTDRPTERIGRVDPDAHDPYAPRGGGPTARLGADPADATERLRYGDRSGGASTGDQPSYTGRGTGELRAARPGDPGQGPGGHPASTPGGGYGWADAVARPPHDAGGPPAGPPGDWDSGAGEQPPAARPRRRRRRRIIAAVVVLVLLVLAVVGDRVGASIAKKVMREKVEASVAENLEPGQTPPTVRSVSIGGFPFLTQVLFGKYKDIGVALDGIPTPGPRIASVDAHLHGVHVPLGDAISDNVGQVPVDKVEATVLMTYEDLNAYLADQPGAIVLEPVDGGRSVRITATVSVPLLGEQQIGGVATFSVQDSRVTLVPESLELAGSVNFGIDIPGGLSLGSVELPLPQLPFDVRIEKAGTTSAGLELSGSARDVVLPAS